ncbi:hypothetical protein BOG92_019875 [Streptomyces sp. WAC00263]|nr:hypothetical protein BOG92_019875 [Streptomyces sp. WAC00263]
MWRRWATGLRGRLLRRRVRVRRTRTGSGVQAPWRCVAGSVRAAALTRISSRSALWRSARSSRVSRCSA